jgi:hypothetical protein
MLYCLFFSYFLQHWYQAMDIGTGAEEIPAPVSLKNEVT